MERKQLRAYGVSGSLGVLGEHFLGAHSLLLSEQEIEILKDRKVKVCPLPVQQLRESGSAYAGAFETGACDRSGNGRCGSRRLKPL